MNLISEPILQPEQWSLKEPITQRCEEQSRRERDEESPWIGILRRDPVRPLGVKVVQKVVVDIEAVADDSERAEWSPTQASSKEAATVDAFQEQSSSEDVDQREAEHAHPV